MLKKFICVMLSIFMLTLSMGTVGFAANHTKEIITASHVTFTDDGGASVTVSATEDGGKAVFWLGEYKDGVLTESAFKVIEPSKGQSVTESLSVTKDTDTVLKAYVWEDVLYGRAVAPVATYPSSSTEILYATANGGVWKEFEENFNPEITEYSMELDRNIFDIPEFKVYAKDNSTQIVEPDAYAVGENKIKIIAQDGTTKEYVLNISYAKPEFKNFTSPSLSTAEIRCVPNISLTGANYTEMLELYGKEGVEGTTAYKSYPSYTASSKSLNNPGAVTSYLSSLGHKEGDLFVFRSSKGPGNTSAWYAGGVGTYDGTNGNYFLTFDIELPGIMYLVLVEGKTNAHTRNFVKEGFAPISSGSNVYKKHYEAGDTVKVPAMGWDESAWGKPEEASDGRKYRDSTYFMFGYDDITAPPVKYDASDVTLKKFTYTVSGESISVPGWSASDKGGVYEVLLPTGTTAVDMVEAVENESFSEVTCDKSGKIELQDGKATVLVTVKAKDGSEAVYTINFTEKAPDPDNADLKEISYTVGDESFVIENFNADVLTYNAQLAPFTEAVAVNAVAAVGNDKATVLITQPVIENKKAVATISVTSIDGSKTKTYTVEFDVALHISEMQNKVYNLKSIDSYKTENNGYQTEEEAATAPNLMVIGENLSASSFKYYTHTGTHKFSVTDDMLGATYIRTKRNHADYKDVKSYSDVTRTVEGSAPATSKLWNGATSTTGFGFRTNAALDKAFYTGAYSAQNGEPGWIEFYVTSDCTVVVGDSVDSGWPNLDKTKWIKSDKITNKINGISYYRTYKAGDLVQIPNYGIAGKLADDTKVTYSYTDSNGAAKTYETTVARDMFVWDEIVVAIKWDVTISDDATLADISANGNTVKGFDKGVTEYTIEVPKGESVVLKATKNHNAATVAPAGEITLTAGESQAFTVTAESGKTCVYTVSVIEEKQTVKLTELKYTLNDILTYDIDPESEDFDITVPSNTEKITLQAKVSDENADAQISDTVIANGKAIANISVAGEVICTVTFTLSKVPFANVVSVDTGIKNNIYKVINAVAENIHAQSIKPANTTEMNEKKAEYQARLDAVNAKYGENTYFGASVYAGYPKLLAYSTAVSIDNPAYFGMNADSAEILGGDSWVLQTAKGGTPTEENGGWSFGTNTEFLKFDVLKSGTLYIVDSNNGCGGQGYLDAGFTKSETKSLVGRKVYEKHFEAGTVIVPAQGAKNLTLGTRITTSNGYVFMFDKEETTNNTPEYEGTEDGGDL